MQKHVNIVDLVKSFPTNIFLQNLASIQKRTSPVKFAYLAEKSGKGSISNLSTKVDWDGTVEDAGMEDLLRVDDGADDEGYVEGTDGEEEEEEAGSNVATSVAENADDAASATTEAAFT